MHSCMHSQIEYFPEVQVCTDLLRPCQGVSIPIFHQDKKGFIAEFVKSDHAMAYRADKVAQAELLACDSSCGHHRLMF